jgi:hypothetical protein
MMFEGLNLEASAGDALSQANRVFVFCSFTFIFEIMDRY